MTRKNLLAHSVFVILTCMLVLSLLEDRPTHVGAILYRVAVDKQAPDRATVQIELHGIRGESVTLRMPRWTPGSYRLREYAQNVSQMQAFDNRGNALPVAEVEPDGWRIDDVPDSVLVGYEAELAFQPWSGLQADSNYVLLEGPGIFMYVDGQTHVPVTVEYVLPAGWDMVSPLKSIGESERFAAESYDHLIDAPAQLGNFDLYEFPLAEAEIELVFHGDAHFEPDSFTAMVEKICRYQVSLFDEIPFERYVFFYKILPGYRSGGGLEHINSTTIGLSGERLSQDILSAAEVTAHEFFHVWNVKRIFPEAFSTLNYDRADRTRALWFSEGVTSYYEALTMLRSGLWQVDDFLDEMAYQVARLQLNDDRLQTSIEKASWHIWERGYGHPGVSFYNKGQLLGMLLDLKIRHLTKNRFSLDDVMRSMNEQFGKTAVGFDDDDIERVVNEISKADLSGFFDAYVEDTHELPYEAVLSFAGLEFVLEEYRVPDAGDVVFVGPANRIVAVESLSSAKRAGLRKGDFLIAIGGAPVERLSDWDREVRRRRIGDTLTVTVRRNGSDIELDVPITGKRQINCQINPSPAPDSLQAVIQSGWFEGWTSQPDSRTYR